MNTYWKGNIFIRLDFSIYSFIIIATRNLHEYFTICNCELKLIIIVNQLEKLGHLLWWLSCLWLLKQVWIFRQKKILTFCYQIFFFDSLKLKRWWWVKPFVVVECLNAITSVIFDIFFYHYSLASKKKKDFLFNASFGSFVHDRHHHHHQYV